MSARRVLVTGGNAGIGLALCKQLVSENGCHVYLGSRSEEKGKAAVESILKDCPAAAGRLELVQIDTSSDESVSAAAETVKGLLGSSDSLYAVVNNAGTGLGHGTDGSAVVSTNLYGPKRVCEAFLPMLSKTEGRVVNVGSGAGPMWLARQDDATKQLLKSGDVTWDKIEALMQREVAKPGLLKDDFAVYGMSKACLHSYTRAFANTHPEIKASVCSPGFIDTAMTKGFGASKSPEEGTVSIRACLFDALPGNGFYYGSDAIRSPLDVLRNPGEPEYKGE